MELVANRLPVYVNLGKVKQDLVNELAKFLDLIPLARNLAVAMHRLKGASESLSSESFLNSDIRIHSFLQVLE